MKDTNTMSQDELDALAAEVDAGLGGTMLAAVYGFLGRFVAYPSEHAHVAHTLWIAHTHLMDRWESTPRIAFLSPEPASGKTRALEVSELLVPHPVCAVNVSPAYLFRKTGSEEGVTILFDEIDTVFGPKAKENEDIRGLLNAGHRRGAISGRCVVHGKTVTTEDIPAYAPVALAGLGWLPDTILSRSVIIRMRRRHHGEKVEPFRRRIHLAEGERIRFMIESWALVAEFELTSPDDLPLGIQDRDADVWESLITISDAIGGKWPELARRAAVALVAESKEVEPSLGIRLLADLRTVFGDHETMASKAMLAALQELPESPWRDLKGKPLDERGLAHRLKQYGVRSKNIALGTSRPKGYVRADLHDAWVRYLPSPSGKSATGATNAIDPGISAEDVADVADSMAEVADAPHTDANKNSNVADVADVADLSGHGGDPGPDNRRRCAQCGGGPETDPPTNQPTVRLGDVWLHAECRRRWEPPADDLSIPDFLMRTAANG
jgi:hypothetical protein